VFSTAPVVISANGRHERQHGAGRRSGSGCGARMPSLGPGNPLTDAAA
jgi:hypothetical protein